MSSPFHLIAALLLALGAVPGIPPFGQPMDALGPRPAAIHVADVVSFVGADGPARSGEEGHPSPTPRAQALTTDLLAIMASRTMGRASIGSPILRRASLGSISPPPAGASDTSSLAWLATCLDLEWRSEHAADGSGRTRTLRGPPARSRLV